VPDGLGEAVGVNYVAAADKPALIAQLSRVDDQDYFERGIELAIEQDGLKFTALDISELNAVEVDTADDLDRANASLHDRGTAP
jgi:choline kinase